MKQEAVSRIQRTDCDNAVVHALLGKFVATHCIRRHRSKYACDDDPVRLIKIQCSNAIQFHAQTPCAHRSVDGIDILRNDILHDIKPSGDDRVSVINGNRIALARAFRRQRQRQRFRVRNRSRLLDRYCRILPIFQFRNVRAALCNFFALRILQAQVQRSGICASICRRQNIHA